MESSVAMGFPVYMGIACFYHRFILLVLVFHREQ